MKKKYIVSLTVGAIVIAIIIIAAIAIAIIYLHMNNKLLSSTSSSNSSSSTWPEGVVGYLTNATTGTQRMSISGGGLSMESSINQKIQSVLMQDPNIIMLVNNVGLYGFFWIDMTMDDYDNGYIVDLQLDQSYATNLYYNSLGQIVDNLQSPTLMIVLRNSTMYGKNVLRAVPYNTTDPSSKWTFTKN